MFFFVILDFFLIFIFLKKVKTMKKIFLSDKFIIGLIIINTVFIFIQGFRTLDKDIIHFASLMDHFITFLFVFEMFIKISHFGWKAYIADSWNKFDFILVIISLPALLTLFVEINQFDMSFLMVFRLMRAFKFFRLIRYIPNMSNLLKGSVNALKTSVLVIAAFMILLVIISLFSCFIFGEVAPHYFGDPLTSMYSIFKIFTVEGWYEIPDEISSAQSGLWMFGIRLYFIVVLFIGGIIGLSLINSIFVDAMVADNNDELEKQVKELSRKIDLLLEEKNNSKL